MAPSCIPIFILFFLSSFCKSDDTLTHAKPLFSGHKLVSSKGVFALGFFSPASSNTSLYLGIWHNQIPDPRFVWVANRDSPISTPSSPMLAITNSSDLVLSDSQGITSWVTKNNISSGGTGVSAVLLDTGNFVLRFANGSYIWQSFDHPTDTILPTMKFLVSHKGQVGGRLVAWKGPDDPSSGGFSCSGDPAFPDLQMLISNGTRPYYRGVWNGKTVSGGMYLSNSSSTVVQTAIDLQDELYFTFTVSDGSPFTFFMLEHTGKLTSLSWNNQSFSWVTIASHPAVACDIYSSCGPFGYCDLTVRGAILCQCLDGFEPNGLNISRGCRRKETLTCGKQSYFVPLSMIKVPDEFLHIPNRSLEECEAECSSNCSCTAYAYTTFSHDVGKADPSRCLVWTGELIDTGKYSSESFFTPGKSINSGENLYLRLADSHVDKITLIRIVLPIMVCVLLTCIALIWIYKCKGEWRKKEDQKKMMQGYFSTSNRLEGENTEIPLVSYEDILSATNFFADSNLLGRGGFGKVYKGTLEDGNEIAVKRLSKSSGQGIVEFKNEVVLIAKLQHKNLVRLLGFCIQEHEKLLIYEYLPNKSLDAFLFDSARKHVLDWVTRFKIIEGVARGLLYLHRDSRLTIIHRDLKASNILLDTEMTPKISDFGMARIFGANQNHANTTRVVGTYGYMSPEYAMGGAFSMKSDTYGYGVLILEIVSGMKISSPQLRTNFLGLITYAWRLWEEGKATELVDSSVVANCPLHEALRCIHVGLLCVQDHPSDRPLMSSVLSMIENESGLLPTPKQPVYFTTSNCEGEEARENMENSLNTISFTKLEGR